MTVAIPPPPYERIELGRTSEGLLSPGPAGRPPDRLRLQPTTAEMAAREAGCSEERQVVAPGSRLDRQPADGGPDMWTSAQ